MQTPNGAKNLSYKIQGALPWSLGFMLALGIWFYTSSYPGVLGEAWVLRLQGSFGVLLPICAGGIYCAFSDKHT